MIVFSSCTEDEDDSFACFSNYGAAIDIMAPGVAILSTYNNGGYTSKSGTSMAAPHVAGAAAVYIVENGPSSNAADVAAVEAGLIAAGDAAPCGDDGCNGDDDGEQEPMVYMGSGCSDDAECDDALFCNGAESCTNGICFSGDPPTCDDGVSCTVDSCEIASDACMNAGSAGLCDNGLMCDGAETCDAVLDCQPGVAPCGAAACSEANGCGCLTNAECDDGLYCNGVETCQDFCVPGALVVCDDAIECTADACDEVSDTCTKLATRCDV